MKVTNIKDWLLYVEDDKAKAFDVTGQENTDELRAMCEANDIPVIGFVAFEREADAKTYGEIIR